jgi:hypothetical protein
MFNSDTYNILEQYNIILEAYKNSLGSIVGVANASGQPSAGGLNGNWGGSMPKLISLLPMGNWKAYSLKRGRKNTKSGYMSDHYVGNTTAYAADFGLTTTFNGNVEAGTQFAIAVARNCGVNVTSWKPYEGKDFKHYTPDGFRIQIIWLSNVGGNHYDHVHLGVKRSSNVGIETQNNLPENDADENINQNNDSPESTNQNNNTPPENNTFGQTLTDIGNSALDYSKSAMQSGLKGVLNQAWGAIASSEGGKKLKNLINI